MTDFHVTTSALGCTRRVLVVDDDQDCRDTMADLLLIHGCQVRTAANGQAALAAVQDFRPEVILLDLAMPGLDGHAVAAAIRADARNDDIVIAAVTGYGRPSDSLRSAAAGVDIHLVKPVPLGDLIDLLRHPTRALAGTRGATAGTMTDRSKHAVLVVDDTPAHRYAIVRGLSSMGFRVLEASSGEEGVAKASGVSVVVLDLFLPDLDGLEVTRRLRAAGARMPIVHHSSLSVTEDDKRQCQLAGGDVFVPSPVRREVLARVIDSAIEQCAG